MKIEELEENGEERGEDWFVYYILVLQPWQQLKRGTDDDDDDGATSTTDLAIQS